MIRGKTNVLFDCNVEGLQWYEYSVLLEFVCDVIVVRIRSGCAGMQGMFDFTTDFELFASA